MNIIMCTNSSLRSLYNLCVSVVKNLNPVHGFEVSFSVPIQNTPK
jgi:hypothetical protein